GGGLTGGAGAPISRRLACRPARRGRQWLPSLGRGPGRRSRDRGAARLGGRRSSAKQPPRPPSGAGRACGCGLASVRAWLAVHRGGGLGARTAVPPSPHRGGRPAAVDPRQCGNRGRHPGPAPRARDPRPLRTVRMRPWRGRRAGERLAEHPPAARPRCAARWNRRPAQRAPRRTLDRNGADFGRDSRRHRARDPLRRRADPVAASRAVGPAGGAQRGTRGLL
ncbi:MAG: hypothetical protein AVDCRST_MAG09-1239, partial [uncultured Sphingomonas sp.]